MDHHHLNWGSLRVAQAFTPMVSVRQPVGAAPPAVTASGGDQSQGEVDMVHITISRHTGARHRHTIAAAFWIVVGIVAVMAFGDTLTLLAVALGIVTTAWWIFRELERRVKTNDAQQYVPGVGFRAGH